MKGIALDSLYAIFHITAFHATLATLSAWIGIRLLKGGRLLYLFLITGALTSAITFGLAGSFMSSAIPGIPPFMQVYLLPVFGSALFLVLFVRIRTNFRD